MGDVIDTRRIVFSFLARKSCTAKSNGDEEENKSGEGRWDGIGSATPAQRGRYVGGQDSANSLNLWCARQELNLRPTGSKPGALSN